MEPEGSLPCSQQPVIGSYPEPDVSINTIRIILIHHRQSPTEVTDESSLQKPTLFP